MPHRHRKYKLRNFNYDLLKNPYSTSFYRYRIQPRATTIQEWDIEQDEWVDMTKVSPQRAKRIRAVNNLYERVIGFTPGYRP